MNRTYKQMMLLVTNESNEMTLEELSTNYKINLNPIYLATAYTKLHPLIISVSQLFFGLSDDDIQSFALEKLDQALQTLDTNKSLLTTFFYTLLKNKLREETQYLNTQKRKVLYNSSSYEKLVEDGFELSSEFDFPEEYSLDGITLKEKEYCKLLILEYTNLEISEMLGVSIMTLCNYRKKLKNKLIPIYKN